MLGGAYGAPMEVASGALWRKAVGASSLKRLPSLLVASGLDPSAERLTSHYGAIRMVVRGFGRGAAVRRLSSEPWIPLLAAHVPLAVHSRAFQPLRDFGPG